MLIAGTKPGDRWYRERLLLICDKDSTNASGEKPIDMENGLSLERFEVVKHAPARFVDLFLEVRVCHNLYPSLTVPKASSIARRPPRSLLSSSSMLRQSLMRAEAFLASVRNASIRFS